MRSSHPLGADLNAVLDRYQPVGDAAVRELQHWRQTADIDPPLWRHDSPAHFTASGLPIDVATGQVCLVHHGRIDLWVQPGGHLEPDDQSITGAALREVREETGLTGTIDPAPVLLSRHAAPCGVDWHLDFEFAVLVEARPPRVSEESHDVAWWGVDALPSDLAPGVADLVTTALARVS